MTTGNEPLIEIVDRTTGEPVTFAMLGLDEFVIGSVLIAVILAGTGVLISLVWDYMRERKKYKNHYDDEDRPNRPGGWGIQ